MLTLVSNMSDPYVPPYEVPTPFSPENQEVLMKEQAEREAQRAAGIYPDDNETKEEPPPPPDPFEETIKQFLKKREKKPVLLGIYGEDTDDVIAELRTLYNARVCELEVALDMKASTRSSYVVIDLRKHMFGCNRFLDEGGIMCVAEHKKFKICENANCNPFIHHCIIDKSDKDYHDIISCIDYFCRRREAGFRYLVPQGSTHLILQLPKFSPNFKQSEFQDMNKWLCSKPTGITWPKEFLENQSHLDLYQQIAGLGLVLKSAAIEIEPDGIDEPAICKQQREQLLEQLIYVCQSYDSHTSCVKDLFKTIDEWSYCISLHLFLSASHALTDSKCDLNVDPRFRYVFNTMTLITGTIGYLCNLSSMPETDKLWLSSHIHPLLRKMLFEWEKMNQVPDMLQPIREITPMYDVIQFNLDRIRETLPKLHNLTDKVVNHIRCWFADMCYNEEKFKIPDAHDTMAELLERASTELKGLPEEVIVSIKKVNDEFLRLFEHSDAYPKILKNELEALERSVASKI